MNSFRFTQGFRFDSPEVSSDTANVSFSEAGLPGFGEKSEGGQGSSKTPPEAQDLNHHLFQQGLKEGRYSDVIISAFDKEYNLHRLILDRSDYFRSLFNWHQYQEENESEDDDSWKNEGADGLSEAIGQQKKVAHELLFDDEYVTKEAFELALARMYGLPCIEDENNLSHNMLAIGSFLGLADIVSSATNAIIESMCMSNVGQFLTFANKNHYGPSSEQIIECGKAILCTSGWEAGENAWDGVPCKIIAEVVGENCFFVPSEWERCIFIMRLIDLRTKPNFQHSNADDPNYALREVLNEKIHYCHLSAEQLTDIAEFTDKTGGPMVKMSVLQSALWQSISLERLIKKSSDVASLGLTICTDNVEQGVSNGWYRAPVRDETVCGTPSQLGQMISDHQYALDASATGLRLSSVADGEFKTTAGNSDSVSEANKKIYNWTKIPPFRFSVAFADASSLNSETRVYAKTLWYAGSYWNLYLQKVKGAQKKGFQIGVYLHRTSAPSTSPKNGILNPDVFKFRFHPFIPRLANRDLNDPLQSLANITKSPTAADSEEKDHIDEDSIISELSSLNVGGSMHDISGRGGSKLRPVVAADSSRSFIAYEDPRSKISVYFVISTPSRRNKSEITSFVSAPDTFNKAQSWGWKSNSMCVFNEDGTFPDDHDENLKFMVVLSVI